MAITLSTAGRNAACDAVVDLLDSGSAQTYPYMSIRDGSGELVKCNFTGTTAFGDASSGVATANTIADGTVSVAGTATIFRLCDQDDATILDGTVSESGGGGDLIMSETTLAVNDTVQVTNLTVTMPAS